MERTSSVPFGMSPGGMGPLPLSTEHSIHSQQSNWLMPNGVPSTEVPTLYPPIMSPPAPPTSVALSTRPPRSTITAVVPQIPALGQHSTPVPQLQNIVSTVNLGCKIDLQAIAMRARNAEYNPKRFAAVIIRIREPRTTALIFSTGKVVCTGAKSEDQSRLAARKYGRIVQKLGFPVKFTGFQVQNMVASCDVRFPIQLEGLCLTHSQFSTYEPELFPGLVYRMVQPRLVILVFVSGKIVITGARKHKDIDEAFGNIYPILKGFKKQ